MRSITSAAVSQENEGLGCVGGAGNSQLLFLVNDEHYSRRTNEGECMIN